MKKPTLILILLIFAACAIGGYFVASKINVGSSNSQSENQTVSTALASQQQNLLLVRVDDLSSPSPKLVETWIVFTAFTDPPQVMFMPLFPVYDAAKNQELASAFGIDSYGDLTDRLIQTIKDQTNTTLNGYILVDTKGLDAIADWFDIEGLQTSANPANSDDEKHALLLNSQFFLQNVCAQLKQGAAPSQFASIQWSKLIPNHFNTDLTFGHLMASWDKINRSSAVQQCEVLSNE